MSDTTIDSVDEQFDTDPTGWQKRWDLEIAAALDNQKKFREDGKKIINYFLDRREGEGNQESRINLFTSNVQTLRALLFGRVPQCDVKRRWGDSNDKIARVAAECMQRLLNTDIERDSDNYTKALKSALSDRLLPGLGVVRVRYVADFRTQNVQPKTRKKIEPDTQQEEMVEIAPGYEEDEKQYEDVEIDYVNWHDFLWSAGARTWGEVRWIAYRVEMTRDALKKRFGDKIGKDVPLNAGKSKDKGDQIAKPDPWQRAEVWEIWDKEHRKVFWVCQGCPAILDQKDDPLGLENFWPSPEPLFANLTTDALMPRADYILAQDLYDDINRLTTRIRVLEKAIRVVGVYNGNCKPLARLLGEAADNEMIAADEWKIFMTEMGGLKGNVDWFPIDMVVAALEKLKEARQEKIALLYQVTGMSDIMRGQSSANTTATEQAIKAKFASVRVQDFQDEFARFASDTLKIKAEIIAKLFDDSTIMNRSNMGFTNDAQLLPQAVQFLRDQFSAYRIQVKPEAVSASDYAAMKQERVEVMQTLAQVLQTILPIGQQAPMMLAPLLEIVKWMFTGFRGANTVEGVIDQAVVMAQQMAQQAMQKAQQPPPPDPKLEAVKVKSQAEIGKAKLDQQTAVMKAKADQTKIGMEMQKAGQDHSHALAEHEMSMQRTEAQMRSDALRSVTDTVGTR